MWLSSGSISLMSYNVLYLPNVQPLCCSYFFIHSSLVRIRTCKSAELKHTEWVPKKFSIYNHTQIGDEIRVKLAPKERVTLNITLLEFFKISKPIISKKTLMWGVFDHNSYAP